MEEPADLLASNRAGFPGLNHNRRSGLKEALAGIGCLVIGTLGFGAFFADLGVWSLLAFAIFPIVVPSTGKVRVIRFWQAFRDFKHGKDRTLRAAEQELARALPPLEDQQ